MPYEERTYRQWVASEGLVTFRVGLKETDLLISAERDLTGLAEDLVVRARWEIEQVIARVPRFAETLAPIEAPEDAAPIVRRMVDAAHVAQVGPMAAVAGAIAEFVAKGLAEESSEVVVENGGDIYMIGETDRMVSVFAGEASLSGRLGLRVPAGLMPVSVCTSSGMVGPSLSLGRADAAVIMARDGALADAVATAIANRVREAEDVSRAVEVARNLHGVLGVLVIAGETLGAWGNVHLVALEEPGSPVPGV